MEINANLFDGKFSGAFELKSADSSHVKYGGRYVFVVVADVKTMTLGETKDGDDKLTYGVKPVDVAVVHSDEKAESMVRDFNLSGLPPGLFALNEGVDDEALERLLQENS